MGDFEVHYEEEGKPATKDPWGWRVGVLTAVIAILASVMTVLADRYRDLSGEARQSAADQWSYYQSKNMNQHGAATAVDIIRALAPGNGTESEELKREQQMAERYRKENSAVQEHAREYEAESARASRMATRLSLAVAALNLATVLASVYFISKRKFFPFAGIAWVAIGLFLAASAWL
ncbi:MAG: DUF4337 family protein [Bryobacteraceae bacterium]